MIIKYFAFYRKAAGCKEETLPLAAVSALDLVKALAERHGTDLRNYLLSADGEAIHTDVIFLIDGRNIDFLDGPESMIEPDSVVSLFPRVAGG